MKKPDRRNRLNFVFRTLLTSMIVLSLFIAFLPQTKTLAKSNSDGGTTDLIITGVIDGPLTGGIPKAIELYAVNDIADLSIYGVSSANNGGGSTGSPEFTFPADSVTSGEFLYLATESTAFNTFFGFNPDYTNSTAPSINGDDAIELFMNGSVVDIFGEVDTDGTGQSWEYLDGWAYRVDETGPDGSTFVLANWTFSGANALDGETTNADAATPFPLGTYANEPTSILMNEFDPNPAGADPTNSTFELSGPASEDFDLWIISIENDGYNGIVDRAANVTGSFDGNGFAVVTVPDLENPSFTVILTDAFTGTVSTTDIDPSDNGTLDTNSLGTILDAIGVSDATADNATMYGTSLGGDDILNSDHAEPFLAFRDGTSGDWFQVYTETDEIVRKADGTEVSGSDFDTDPTSSGTFNTFGAANPSYQGPSDTAPEVSSTTPEDSATGVALDSNIVINFSEDVTVSPGWYDVTCSTSGTHSVSVTGGLASYTLDPDSDFSNNEVCTVTIEADYVVDQDATPDNMTSDYVFSFTTDPGAQCGQPATLISAVQGSDTGTSPLNTSVVTVEGVVVADHQASDELSGFFLQEEDADADADPLSSEGVFIYDPSGTDVAVGDVVRLTGTVDEYYGNTQIKTITALEICSSGATLPSAAALALPLTATDDLEDVEGMLVTFAETLYVTETYNLGRYGEVHLSGTAVLDNPTNVAEPGPASDAIDAANDLNRVLLDDASGVQNPPVVEHLRTTNDTLRLGDTTTGLTGTIYYAYDYYRIQPVGDVVFSPDAGRSEGAPDVGGTLKVASFNVLNYFTTFGSRGADDQTEFDRQRDKIINAIILLDADVIGLMEIENNGYGDETSAIDDLVDGLNDVAGAGTYAFIDAGGPIGTDEIAVGLIYKPASVTPTGTTAILDSSFSVLFDDTRNRPALTQSFTEIATGETFTVIVNHLKSKGSSCGAGDDDTRQGNCNLTRTVAAEVMMDWVTSDPTGVADPDFLIIGDLNAYAMEDPIDAIKAGVDDTPGTADDYTDLVAAFGGSEPLYSYVFAGERGYLDHALASADLTPFITGTTHWHINADEPRILDYNTNYGQGALGLYVADQYRSSDHDPVVIGLALGALETPALTSPARGAIVGNMDVTYTWEHNPGVDSYTLEIKKVDDNSGVHKANYSATARCDGSTCSVTVPGSLALESHKWHVRAWNGTEGSDWSAWNAFDVTLDQVELRSPGVDAMVYGGRPTFKWYPVNDAASYIIELYGPSDTLLGTWQKNPVCAPYCEYRIPGTLDLGSNYGEYDWRIRAKNGAAEGEWSETRTFDYTRLDRTWQISPDDEHTTTDPSPTLQWGEITGATVYLMQIRDQSDNLIVQTLVSDALYCTGGICTWDVDPELAIGDYKWHVRAKNGRNFGRWTAYRDLEITAPAP